MKDWENEVTTFEYTKRKNINCDLNLELHLESQALICCKLLHMWVTLENMPKLVLLLMYFFIIVHDSLK